MERGKDYRAQAEALVAAMDELGFYASRSPFAQCVDLLTDALTRCAAEAVAEEREAMPASEWKHRAEAAEARLRAVEAERDEWKAKWEGTYAMGWCPVRKRDEAQREVAALREALADVLNAEEWDGSEPVLVAARAALTNTAASAQAHDERVQAEIEGLILDCCISETRGGHVGGISVCAACNTVTRLRARRRAGREGE